MASSLDYTMYRGVTFRRTFSYYTPGTPDVPIDLSGGVVRFLITRTIGAVESDVLELASSASSANDNGSRIQITDADAGEFSLVLGKDEVTAFDFDEGEWALLLDLGGVTDRLGGGRVTVERP